MDPAEADKLRAEWERNEAELQRIRQLPTGSSDPAERERQLDARQDEIEFLLGTLARQARGEG